MRAVLAVALAAALSGCINIPTTTLTFEIDCPVPPGRDIFAPSGEVSCVATGPLTRVADPDWSFGDGARAEGDEVAHTYGGPGSYALRATIGAVTKAARIGIPAEYALAGEAPLAGAVGTPPTSHASVTFDVLPDALQTSIVVETPDGPTRLGLALVAPDGTPLGGCACTTPAEYPLVDPLPPGTYELRVWAEAGPGYAPATTTPFEAQVSIPYASTFSGPFRLDWSEG